jgi:hypothetical protein
VRQYHIASLSDGAAADGTVDSSGAQNCYRDDRLSHFCCRRAALANDLCAIRKRSVVPVLLSVLWFLVSMAISIGKAFRSNYCDAFDLALRFLVSWLPAVVTCTVVDGGPTSSGHTRQALQQLLDTAAAAAVPFSIAAAVAGPAAASSAAAGPAASGPAASVPAASVSAAANHARVCQRKQHRAEEVVAEEGNLSTARIIRRVLPSPEPLPAILLHDSA